eukprot:7281017-Heterocapsa_arctica.AAC.1
MVGLRPLRASWTIYTTWACAQAKPANQIASLSCCLFCSPRLSTLPKGEVSWVVSIPPVCVPCSLVPASAVLPNQAPTGVQ